MAKQLVNPVERHVEKVVTSIAGLLLIGAVARYLVTSPNQVQIGTETVTPATIDQVLAQKAASVRDRIRTAAAEVQTPDKLLPVFERSLDPFAEAKLAVELPRAVALGPEVPLVDSDLDSPMGRASLVAVTPFADVRVVHGRSVFLFKESDGSPRHTPVNWVTLSGLFDVRAHVSAQSKAYGAVRKDVYFGPPQIQRRERRADRSWSDQDWKDISPWPSKELGNVPRVDLVQDDQGNVFVPAERKQDITRYEESLIQPAAQLAMVRPLMWEIVKGDVWDAPSFGNRRELLMQDDYYLAPNDPPSANPADRYRPEEDDRTPIVAEDAKPQRITQQFDEIQKLIKLAKDTNSADDALRAYNKAFDIQQDPQAAAGEKDRAKRLAAEAEQVEKDIRRRILTGGVRPGPQVKPGGEKAAPKRESPAVQQLWAHDAAVGSVRSGVTYQYRILPRIYNRLFGMPERFKDPTDAQKLFVAGEWSAPIEVTIPPSTEWYFTSEDERNRKVSAELYQWYDGVWTKTREQYGIGSSLKVVAKAEVPALDDPTAVDKTDVTFEADGVIVDLDFQRSFRERRKGAGRTGVKFGAASPACCVVFADSAGRLHERFVPAEKSHPGKLAAEERTRVWRTKKG